MKLFEKIYNYCKAKFNKNLKIIVRIHSNNACESYKRKPIINEKIKYETIKYFKYVDEIIEDAPLETTVEFIKTRNIDYVSIGEEYKDKMDKNMFFIKML